VIDGLFGLLFFIIVTSFFVVLIFVILFKVFVLLNLLHLFWLWGFFLLSLHIPEFIKDSLYILFTATLFLHLTSLWVDATEESLLHHIDVGEGYLHILLPLGRGLHFHF
jgi:hypothetical protein